MNEFQRKLLDTARFTSWVAAFADPARTLLGLESYAYVIDRRGLTTFSNPGGGGVPLVTELVMDSDSEFVCTYLSGGATIDTPAIATPANGNQVVEFSPAIEIQITDRASGRTWFDVPTALPLIAGAGGFPYILTSPRITKPRSTIEVAATVIDTGFAVDCDAFFFVLHGAKLYYSGPTP